MKKIIIVSLLTISGCTATTPLPDVKGTIVRPLNPTKWDFEEALQKKQAEIGFKKIGSGNDPE